MLTQLEDLSLIILNLVNYILFLFVLPIILIQMYLFFTPAFFLSEKNIIYKLLTVFVFGIIFTMVLSYYYLNFFYFIYLNQMPLFNLSTSTQLIIDLKKVMYFILIFFKYNLFIFLPINLGLLLSLFSFKKLFFKVKDLPTINILVFIYLYFLDFIPVDNGVQLVLFYIVQFTQLEVLIFFKYLLFKKIKTNSNIF